MRVKVNSELQHPQEEAGETVHQVTAEATEEEATGQQT